MDFEQEQQFVADTKQYVTENLPLSKISDEDLKEQIKEIVEIKKNDINARSEEAAMKIIEGTARSMGVEVIDG